MSAERTSDTVEFFLTSIAMPKLSAVDAEIHTSHLLIEALKIPHPMIPHNNLPIQQQQALSKLAEIFSTALSQHNTAVLRVKIPLEQHPNVPAPVRRVPSKNPTFQGTNIFKKHAPYQYPTRGSKASSNRNKNITY